MRGKSNKSRKPTATRLVCAVCFLLFTFSWLYWFQADLLAVAQHGLSGGVTHYDRTVGAVIITAVLYVLHLLVYALVRLSRRTHALTYLPSFMLLAFVSGIGHPFRWGAWLWAGPLVLVLWGVTVVLARKVLPFDNDAKQPVGFFSRRAWLNLLQMVAMMLGVAAVSNTQAVAHFKARAEVALAAGDTDGALRVGDRSLETDESLTMLRIFALARKGQLGERLFCYPVRGTSGDMLPLLGSKARLELMPDTLLWDLFGVRPDSIVRRADSLGTAQGIRGGRLTVGQYLDSLARDTLATAAWRDYRLTGLLIDRQIDSFALSLPRHYALCADSLPRHYREALVLYQQQRDTLFDYRDSLMLLRWADFRRNDSVYPDARERQVRTMGDFRDTYWYYYRYK